MHFALRLPDGRTPALAAAVVRAAAAREVVVADVSRYCRDPANATAALVIGYANLADTAVQDAVGQLAEASTGILPGTDKM